MNFRNLRSCVLFPCLLFFSICRSQAQEKQDFTINSFPGELPDNLTLNVVYSGEKLTVELIKNKVFGKNTRFLVDDGSGNLIEIHKGKECTYQGVVVEHPDYSVDAIVTAEGLESNIQRSDRDVVELRPSGDKAQSYQVYMRPIGEQNVTKSASISGVAAEIVQNSCLLTFPSNEKHFSANIAQVSSATLPPINVIDVYDFEVGVEIGSRAFFASTAYNGDLAIAQAKVQTLPVNMDKRYLHGAGVKHVLGTVIIRTNTAADPNRETITGTGGSSTANASLTAFRDYWNTHPLEVGNTHDLAIYHVLSAPSGLAWVNSVGGSNRYATVGGNGPDSWANGTAVHEFGHSWNLAHNNSSGLFYESKPRNNAGSATAGGSDVFVSVMNGSGDHNIARLATEEAAKVLEAKEKKLSFGTRNNDPGPVKPFGAYDKITIISSESPVLIDVIANDYDANNDVLDVRLLDTVSQKGAKISLSEGTGPGGRNQIVYTPVDGSSESDFFHYTVFDATGRTDFGAVYVSYSTTGISMEKALPEIIIAPNPVTDILTVSLSGGGTGTNTYVRIYNALGVAVKEVVISGFKNSIDVSYLKSGVYFLRIFENNTVVKDFSFIKLD